VGGVPIGTRIGILTARAGPNLGIEDKVLDPFILLELFVYNPAIHPSLRVVGEVYCKA
jgi:hypothetical protein